jgi:hypothetical protein
VFQEKPKIFLLENPTRNFNCFLNSALQAIWNFQSIKEQLLDFANMDLPNTQKDSALLIEI